MSSTFCTCSVVYSVWQRPFSEFQFPCDFTPWWWVPYRGFNRQTRSNVDQLQSTRYHDQRCNDPNYKTYIQHTLTEVTRNQHLSLWQASRKTEVSEVLYNVLWKVFMAYRSQQTLSDRAKGRHDSWTRACAKQQLLSPEEEDTIVNWCELLQQMPNLICTTNPKVERVMNPSTRKTTNPRSARQFSLNWQPSLSPPFS